MSGSALVGNVRIAVSILKFCNDNMGKRLALDHLSLAFSAASKAKDNFAMSKITRMRNWLRADLNKSARSAA